LYLNKKGEIGKTGWDCKWGDQLLMLPAMVNVSKFMCWCFIF